MYCKRLYLPNAMCSLFTVAGFGFWICFIIANLVPVVYFNKYRYIASICNTTATFMGMILGLFYFELLDPLVGWYGAVMILTGISMHLLPVAFVMRPLKKKFLLKDKETDPEQDKEKPGKQRGQESTEYIKEAEQQSKESNGKETDNESKKNCMKESDQSNKDNNKQEDRDNKRKGTDLESQSSQESTLASDKGTINICGHKVGLLTSCNPPYGLTLSPDAKRGLKLLNKGILCMTYLSTHFTFQIVAGGFAIHRFLGTSVLLLQSGDPSDAAFFITACMITFMTAYIQSQASFLKTAYSSRYTNLAAVSVHLMSLFSVTLYGIVCLVPAICG